VGGGSLLLYVMGDDGAKDDWTRVGTNPYLDAIDYDVNYVSINTNKVKSVGDFDFDDSLKSVETINSVTIKTKKKPFVIFIFASPSTTILIDANTLRV